MDVYQATRRCTGHETLDGLTAHLFCDFPAIAPTVVARQVARAVAAVTWMGLTEDQLIMTELLARVQLELRSGQREDMAHA